MNIASLPDSALHLVSSFLPVIERALLSIALSKPSTKNDETSAASAIVAGASQPVEELDFVHVDKDLAAKLNDGHLSGILTFIGAPNHLKKLKLTGCTGITGRGLEPLRGSTVLQLIDLSLVGHREDPDGLPKEALISEADVLPILDSIIERGEDSALKYIHYPGTWDVYSRFSSWGYSQRNPSEEFKSFEERFRLFAFGGQQRQCCGQDSIYDPSCGDDATIYLCCYKCLKSAFVCFSCDSYHKTGLNELGNDAPIMVCHYTEKYFCQDCNNHEENCTGCGEHACRECSRKCKGCERSFHWWCPKCCDDEIKNCDGNHPDCKQEYCRECSVGGHCSHCEKTLCSKCCKSSDCFKCRRKVCLDFMGLNRNRMCSGCKLSCNCSKSVSCLECIAHLRDQSGFCSECIKQAEHRRAGNNTGRFGWRAVLKTG